MSNLRDADEIHCSRKMYCTENEHEIQCAEVWFGHNRLDTQYAEQIHSTNSQINI